MTLRGLASIATCVLLAACAPSGTGPGAASPRASTAAPGPAPSTASSPANTSPEKALAERDERDLARMYGWIAISIGSLSGIVALYTSGQMLHDKSVRDSDCTASKVCSSAGLDANSEISSQAGWNVGSWVVAAAGLGVGAFLVLTNRSEPQAGTQIGVGPTGSGAGLTVRSPF